MALPAVRVPEEVELVLSRVLRAAGELHEVEAHKPLRPLRNRRRRGSISC